MSSGKFSASQSPSSVLHIFAGERLQAFSDAVFAIIATLMVIPLKLSREDVEANHGTLEDFNLDEFMLNQWSRYLVYVYSFSLVVDMWYSHVGIFSIIEQVDDVIIWLNLLCLMLISFLPYGTGLISTFPTSKSGESIAITICALDLMLIGICMFVILLYAFRRQSLLHPEVERNQNIVSIRRASIIAVLITPCVSFLAMCFSLFVRNPYLSLVLFYSVGVLSFFTRLAVYFYYKRRKNIAEDIPCHLFNSVGSTIRTEAFSDGIFSIVATLIVLDLTTETILTPEELDEKFDGDLKKALKPQRYVIVAYITSFVVVGLLWFVHYGMMHFIEKMTPALNFINNTSLFLVGGIPYVSGIHTIFSEKSDEGGRDSLNKAVSVRAFSVLLFLIGIWQLVFWTVALFQKDTCMSRSVDKYSSEALQFCKIIVFPILSFIIFWSTFSDSFVYYDFFNYLLFSAPIIFLVLKVAFRRHEKAWKKMRMLRHKLRNRQSDGEVNACADERTSLIRGKAEGRAEATHIHLVGKGEAVDIEVT